MDENLEAAGIQIPVETNTPPLSAEARLLAEAERILRVIHSRVGIFLNELDQLQRRPRA